MMIISSDVSVSFVGDISIRTSSDSLSPLRLRDVVL